MVIDAVTSASLSLVRSGKLPNVGVIVINPAHRHIIGNLQSCVVERECFLVGNVDLGHFRGVATKGICDDFALSGDNVGKSLELSSLPFITEKGNILKSSHAYIVDSFVVASLTSPFCPIVVTTFRIRRKREIATIIPAFEARPFPEIVAKHTVARTHDNRPSLRQTLVLFQRPKGSRTAVLSRPKAVGTQSQQKFHYFLVSIRAYVVVGGIDGLPCPREKCPIFVVDEEATILYGRLFYLSFVALNIDAGHRSRLHIGPPYIRRNADSAADLEESVGRSSWCSTHNDEGLADVFGGLLNQLKRVGFPNSRQACGIDLSVGNEVVQDG